VALSRVAKRNRKEELPIQMEYIREIHRYRAPHVSSINCVVLKG
jgi:hypothetical protein